MSKTSEFGHGFASNLPIEGVEWAIEGKIITLDINNENTHVKFQIKLTVTKISNKAEIWENNHFLGRCSGENQVDLADKLTEMVIKEVEDKNQKEASQTVNGELCDYLTTEFEKNGFTIINKGSNTNRGSYTVQGPSGDKYLVVASYQDAEVQVSMLIDNESDAHLINTFNLSNPDIEKVICKSLLKYDSGVMSDLEKSELEKEIEEMVFDIYKSRGGGAAKWDIIINGRNIACVSKTQKHRPKYRLVLEEIK